MYIYVCNYVFDTYIHIYMYKYDANMHTYIHLHAFSTYVQIIFNSIIINNVVETLAYISHLLFT